MYPTVMPNVITDSLARTGAPIAFLLVIATLLLVAGMFTLRTSSILRAPGR